jgi:hypothetical protein
MEKWAYKYSFLSGILFIVSFFLKEVVLFSPKSTNIAIFITPYIFMMLYVVGLFLGYLKYSILNENFFLKLTATLLIFAYPLIILSEILDRIFNISVISPFFVTIPKFLLAVALLVFSIALFKQKKIYGKFTILQGISSALFSVSFLIPDLFLFQLPLFLIFFISLTYLVNKKIIEKEEFKGRLL